MCVERPGVAQPGAWPVPARIAWGPAVDLGARQAEHFGHVGDQRQIAEQQGGEAGHRLDAEFGGHPVKAGRVGVGPGHPSVVEPLPRSPGSPSGPLGAGSRPRSKTGGRKDPACSVTSGIPASLVDSSAVSVQPVTATLTW